MIITRSRLGILLAAGLAVSLPGLGAVAQERVPLSAAAVKPGKGLSPQISDPGRVQLILKIISDVYYGKPLPFPKDGVVFQNREGILPAKPNGYYHEYTVLPPAGSPTVVAVGDETFTIPPPPDHNRGAERLIIGGGEVLYYTPDHYKTFIELQVLR